MKNMKTIALTKTRAGVKLAVFAVFLAVSIAAPFIKQQFITGPIVNAVLYISTATLGIGAGVLIGFLPSMISAWAGLLPIPLLPMIPYIIMGNAILVLTFGVLRKKNFWLGVGLASVLKFMFLFLSSSFIINFFIKTALPKPIIAMMAWPQLITALAGGIIAFILLKIIKVKT
ncbi:hypothetical protein AMJ47_01145 [Parcubacteria bacterium DG_72]|nr:MAG: hypothetical protein AMJ47_01145 [Parcubacteria bacterium DG_72]